MPNVEKKKRVVKLGAGVRVEMDVIVVKYDKPKDDGREKKQTG